MADKQDQFIVADKESGVFIRDYLNERIGYLSAKGIRKAIRNGQVLVNQTSVASNYCVQKGDVVTLQISRPQKMLVATVEIPIVYADEHLAVVHKPAGMVTSGRQKNALNQQVSAVLKPSAHSDGLLNPKCLHRLDKATSGLVVVAKTRDALTSLAKQFESRSVEKYYLAIVEGTAPNSGSLTQPINNQSARTNFIKIKDLKEGTSSLLYIKLETGRQHQIRRHMQMIGHPVQGDVVYGAHKLDNNKHICLQAWQVTIKHPDTAEKLQVSDTPADFLLNYISESQLKLLTDGRNFDSLEAI